MALAASAEAGMNVAAATPQTATPTIRASIAFTVTSNPPDKTPAAVPGATVYDRTWISPKPVEMIYHGLAKRLPSRWRLSDEKVTTGPGLSGLGQMGPTWPGMWPIWPLVHAIEQPFDTLGNVRR